MSVNDNSSSSQPSTLLFKSCTDWQSVLQTILIVVVMILSFLGNGAICCLLIRFRSLRTVPNILVVNLAFIDVINAVTNMPLFVLWYQCQVRFLVGSAVSWFIVMWYVLFMYLTVVSLVVLMLDRYGAIVHGIRYHSWKTKNKAMVSVVFIWMAAMVYTFGMFSLGIDINIGPMPVWIYRIQYFQKFGRSFLIPGYLVPFAVIVVLGLLIWREVHISTRAIAPQSNMDNRRIRTDVQTAKTLGITILAYFWMGCFPVLLHSVAKLHGSWIHFLAFLFVFMNSMANPVIYSLRTRRFRSSLWLLLRDPCGDSQPRSRRARATGSSTGGTTVENSTCGEGTGYNVDNDNTLF